mmetsp:Transcript_3671/g.10477  ORF Transcript_3671/g.10477 Transcript_3671/m.10477 type:complete len:263 (-) Transcript_3671:185-973(-)
MTTASLTGPNLSKCARKSASPKDEGRPPTKNFRETLPPPPYSAPGALGAPPTGRGRGWFGSVGGPLPSIAPSAVFTKGGGALPWGTAGLISTLLPSIVWMPATTLSAVAASLKVTKPKPRDTPVVLLRMTAASVTSPNLPKYSLIASSSVAHVMPPRNNLPSRPSCTTGALGSTGLCCVPNVTCDCHAAPPTAAVPLPIALTMGTPLETAPGTGAGSFATAVVDVTNVSQSSSDSLSTTVSSKAIMVVVSSSDVRCCSASTW